MDVFGLFLLEIRLQDVICVPGCVSPARSHTSKLTRATNTAGEGKVVLRLQEKEGTQGTLVALCSVCSQGKNI